MLNVLNNDTVKAITNETFAGVICGNRYNVVVAIGNTEKEVHDDAYFTWAVMWDYEGYIKVLPIAEINVMA